MRLSIRFIVLGSTALTLWTNEAFALDPNTSNTPKAQGKVDIVLDVIYDLPSNIIRKFGSGSESRGSEVKENNIEVSNASNENPPPPPKKTIASFGCECLGSHGVTDWLNTINIGSFFDYSSKFVQHHSECFVYLDSCQNLSFWAEPYGFYSHYASALKDKKKIDFTLTSYGTAIGARYSFSDEIHLGGVLGYFHSNTLCGNGTHVNGVYLGPSIEYLFTDGSVGLTFFGVGNFYQGKSEVSFSDKTTKTAHYNTQSWDIDVRLETEYMIEPPIDFFIQDLTFHPFLRIDYLNVFELSHHDKIEDKMSIDIASRHSSYFYSKLGIRFERVMLCNPSGILTSNINLGWINMTPLSGDSMEWKEKEAKKDSSFDSKPESKNQLDLEAGLIGMYKSGFLVALEYAAAIGARAPMQTGRVRLEWNW